MRCLGAQGQCEWSLYCAFLTSCQTWQLQKVINTHNCSREFGIHLMNSKWLSKSIDNSLRENPNLKLVDICNKTVRKWNTKVTVYMAHRAKVLAAKEVEGSFRDQYKRICDYAYELIRSNPGSTVKIKVEDVNGDKIFMRFYTCLKACKDSFISCRPIIGLDGCFLKGQYGGELLTAVARDTNDQMLPLAYAIVEVESKDTWSWFLELLVEDLGGPDICMSCTFMSDQQKVLFIIFDCDLIVNFSE